jgi:4-aminobutyrate aminotransferase-like enzyme
MALAQIREIERLRLAYRSATLGALLLAELSALAQVLSGSGYTATARGLGLMAGLELRLRDGAPATDAVLSAIKSLLQQGFIFLPEGEQANVLSFTPPLTISDKHLGAALHAVAGTLMNVVGQKGGSLL